MVFCRNYTAGGNADQKLIYEIMDALHEIPQILNQWGGDNNIEKVRMYFACFDHAKWCNNHDILQAPDLVNIFNIKLNEYKP